jgi:hypothetical protein
MTTPPAGHNHSGKSHLLGMLAAGLVALVVLLAAGRSFGEALPLAALLACPLMMIGMLFMMGRGSSHGAHGSGSQGGSCHAETDDRPVVERPPEVSGPEVSGRPVVAEPEVTGRP